MAADNIAICNLALAKIGVRSITTLSDNSKEARLCNTFYNHVRDKLMESHPWGFCIKREELTATGTTPVWKYDHEFALPATYLRLLDIEDETEWDREGDYIYAHSATINVKYIQKITDTTKHPPAFDEALASELAAYLVWSLHQDKALKAQYMDEAEWWKARARSTGAMESSAKQLNPKTLIDSRL